MRDSESWKCFIRRHRSTHERNATLCQTAVPFDRPFVFNITTTNHFVVVVIRTDVIGRLLTRVATIARWQPLLPLVLLLLLIVLLARWWTKVVTVGAAVVVAASASVAAVVVSRGGRSVERSVGRSVGRSVVRIASSGSNDEDDGDDGSGWMCQSAGLRQNERKARLTGSHGSVASPTPRWARGVARYRPIREAIFCYYSPIRTRLLYAFSTMCVHAYVAYLSLPTYLPPKTRTHALRATPLSPLHSTPARLLASLDFREQRSITDTCENCTSRAILSLSLFLSLSLSRSIRIDFL